MLYPLPWNQLILCIPVFFFFWSKYFNTWLPYSTFKKINHHVYSRTSQEWVSLVRCTLPGPNLNSKSCFSECFFSSPCQFHTSISCALEHISVEKSLKAREMSPHRKQAGKTILTAGSEEERVIIAFIFNGRKRDNLYKVICFKFHIQERLRFHALKGNKNTCDVTEKSPTPPPTCESSGLPWRSHRHSSRAGGRVAGGEGGSPESFLSGPSLGLDP